jgi:hypothetical protein
LEREALQQELHPPLHRPHLHVAMPEFRLSSFGGQETSLPLRTEAIPTCLAGRGRAVAGWRAGWERVTREGRGDARVQATGEGSEARIAFALHLLHARWISGGRGEKKERERVAGGGWGEGEAVE